MECSNNLKQVGLVLQSYATAQGVLPPSVIGCDSGTDRWDRCADSYFSPVRPRR
jgi:hypothetical protein